MPYHASRSLVFKEENLTVLSAAKIHLWAESDPLEQMKTTSRWCFLENISFMFGVQPRSVGTGPIFTDMFVPLKNKLQDEMY